MGTFAGRVSQMVDRRASAIGRTEGVLMALREFVDDLKGYVGFEDADLLIDPANCSMDGTVGGHFRAPPFGTGPSGRNTHLYFFETKGADSGGTVRVTDVTAGGVFDLAYGDAMGKGMPSVGTMVSRMAKTVVATDPVCGPGALGGTFSEAVENARYARAETAERARIVLEPLKEMLDGLRHHVGYENATVAVDGRSATPEGRVSGHFRAPPFALGGIESDRKTHLFSFEMDGTDRGGHLTVHDRDTDQSFELAYGREVAPGTRSVTQMVSSMDRQARREPLVPVPETWAAPSR